MNKLLHDVIRAAHEQWILMNESRESKTNAYQVVSEKYDIEEATMDSCFFCDYADLNYSGCDPCSECPAIGMWGNDNGISVNCETKGSEYRHWLDTGDKKPMLDLIKRVADKHGVDL